MDLEQGSKKKSNGAQAGRAKSWHGKAAAHATRAKAPAFIEPELATLVSEVPEGLSWLHEAKYDGYRIIARKDGDDITLFSRSGLDWTVRFPLIAKAMETFPAESAMIDGEVAFVLPSGITAFKSLQEHIDTPHPAIRYFVFDLLSLDSKDWRKKTMMVRQTRDKVSDGYPCVRRCLGRGNANPRSQV